MRLPPHLEGAVTFAFGDTPPLADELLALVLAGKKTATCGDLREFGDAEPIPEVGRQDVVLDGAGRPAAVIETVELRLLPFDAVDEAFALEEGEGSFAEWRAAHEAYFARNHGFDPKMTLVCERFRLVEVLPRDGA
ncbi:MAG: ASCH domain-containing protein [Pseudomonadota bacterium]